MILESILRKVDRLVNGWAANRRRVGSIVDMGEGGAVADDLVGLNVDLREQVLQTGDGQVQLVVQDILQLDRLDEQLLDVLVHIEGAAGRVQGFVLGLDNHFQLVLVQESDLTILDPYIPYESFNLQQLRVHLFLDLLHGAADLVRLLLQESLLVVHGLVDDELVSFELLLQLFLNLPSDAFHVDQHLLEVLLDEEGVVVGCSDHVGCLRVEIVEAEGFVELALGRIVVALLHGVEAQQSLFAGELVLVTGCHFFVFGTLVVMMVVVIVLLVVHEGNLGAHHCLVVLWVREQVVVHLLSRREQPLSINLGVFHLFNLDILLLLLNLAYPLLIVNNLLGPRHGVGHLPEARHALVPDHCSMELPIDVHFDHLVHPCKLTRSLVIWFVLVAPSDEPFV